MTAQVQWQGSLKNAEEAAEYDIEIDEFGVGSSTIYRQYEWSGAKSIADIVEGFETHPEFPWLKRKSARISRQEANFTTAQITFVGIPPNTDKATYRMTASLGSAPIETHPRFQELIEEGLVSFDPEEGTLVWSQTDKQGEENKLFGTESWLQPTLIYEETWVRGSKGSSRDFRKIGLVETPPKSDARPQTPDGTNFLFMGGNIELIGFGSKMTRRWKLSSGGPWSEKLYKKR